MGERKGQQKYYPPDFDWKKHSSLNAYHGVHPLRERASKLKTEGILVVRFELPYNIYCLGCKKHIAMGVRYNARKKNTGNYFSTKIWTFRMKCHLCENWIEIRTDPEANQNRDYAIVSGARKAVEDYDPESAGIIHIDSEKTKDAIEADPFYKLEHEAEDMKKGKESQPFLTRLIENRDVKSKDDYEMNRLLRRKNRTVRKVIKRQREEDREHYPSLDLNLLPPESHDLEKAKGVKFYSKSSTIEEHSRKRRILDSSIFSSKAARAQKKEGKEKKMELLKMNLRRAKFKATR